MKIRHGFVSNSSTTSFCIYGIFLSDNEYEDIDCVEKLADNAGLECYSSPDCCDGAYVGLSPESMNKDLTLKEIQDRIKDTISKNFNIEDPHCYWYNESWYDG